MTRLALLPLLFLAPGPLRQEERPTLLMVQKLAAEEFGSDAVDFPMLDILRAEFGEDGRLNIIAWQKKDVKFSEGTADIALPDEPTDELISEVARKVRAKYILVVEATRHQGSIYPRADLFQSGRKGSLWTTGPKRLRAPKPEPAKKGDPPKKGVPPQQSNGAESHIIRVGDEIDWEATGRSLAKTWVLQISTGPLKALGLGDTVLPNPLFTELGPRPAQLEIGATAGQEALAAADDFVNRGMAESAILYLKDAVDANPFESERRIRLMELLSQQGLPGQAANEGRRAARLTANKPELWLFSAKAWLLADRPDDAKADVKEALARGVDSALARRLLGDIALIEGDLPKARDEYSLALEKEDNLRSRLGLSISFSMIGQPELAKAILTKEPAVKGSLSEGDYAFVVEMISPIAHTLSKGLADLMPKLRTNPKNAALLEESMRFERQARALSEVLALVSPPSRHSGSHEARVLAHKLMYQASQEVLSFAKGGDPEAELEVVLSLGEALRQLGSARNIYRSEREDG